MVDNKHKKYFVKLPANMAGEFISDFLPQSMVTLNGEEVDLSHGSIRLKAGLNNIDIRIKTFRLIIVDFLNYKRLSSLSSYKRLNLKLD